MIKGNLKLVSVPGLLQLLANEPDRSYRITLESDGQIAHLYVVEGELIDSRFGILEGIDALSEVLSWTEGEFMVDNLKDAHMHREKALLRCNLEELGSFQDQCSFLRSVNIGLASELIPSSSFGQPEWQESLYIQPLGKNDYTVLGWITDGRTMRQAMSELEIDLRTAVGILYRLVLTGSVEVVKADIGNEAALNIAPIVARRIEKVAARKVGATSGATIVSIKDDRPDSKQLVSKEVPLAEEVKAVIAAKDAKNDTENDTSESLTVPNARVSLPGKDTDTQELPAVGSMVQEEIVNAVIESPLSNLIEKEVAKEAAKEEKKAEKKRQQKGSVKTTFTNLEAEQSPFDMKRTDPLPLVSIDIERLLNTSFKLTGRGAEHLEEASEDDMVAEVLQDVKLGKSLLLVLTDSNRSDASIMATYRYCLDNEMIEHHDPVVRLTIELLLDKLDLIKYLMQRRRVTGEQLKELSVIAERQGIEIIKLLIGSGAVLPADLDRLKQEQERFAPK